MKSDLPPWLARYVSPALVFLAVAAPVLKLQEYVDPKNALGIAATLTLIAAAWTYNVWTTRLESSVYGATGKRYRFSRWVRYGLAGSLFICLAVTIYAGWGAIGGVSNKPAHAVEHRIPFSIYNRAPTTPIWMPAPADIHVLAPQTPATDQVVASVRARVEMPNVFTFGGQPQVDSQTTEVGYVKLPEKFEIQRYLDRGFTIRLLLQIEPSGKIVHADTLLDETGTKQGFKLEYRL